MSKQPVWRQDKSKCPRRFTIPGLINAGINLRSTLDESEFVYTNLASMTPHGSRKTETFKTFDALLDKW